MNKEIKMITGMIALLIAGVLTSLLLCKYHKDIIILGSIIVFIYIFLKCFQSEEIEKSIFYLLKGKTGLGFFLFVAVAVELKDLAYEKTGMAEFFLYLVSFICWICGLFLFHIREEEWEDHS